MMMFNMINKIDADRACARLGLHPMEGQGMQRRGDNGPWKDRGCKGGKIMAHGRTGDAKEGR